ncbi:MAG: S41 family peptidase [Candidatus Gastranaerophilales bacterium]|nr:S41 family peptidase [Candidatus Gastranaerophilales bacterium]
MLKINKNKIIQFILLFFGAFILYTSGYNSIQNNNIERINLNSDFNIINKKDVSAQELYEESWSIIKNNYYKKDLNEQDWARWKNRYKNKIKTQEDAYIAINTMIATLNDSYSKFMTAEEFQEQNRSINSKLYGIGINIASVSGKIHIVNVLKNAPAYNQGIKAGDIILKVNNDDVSGQSIYHVAQLIRGDKDALLDLEILRGNEKFSKTIKREEIKIKTVDYKKLNEDIGYIRISSFIGLDTTKEFVVALNKLKDSKGLILDLRGNSGGLFQNATVIADLFMKKGVIVQVIARHNKKNIYSASQKGCIYENPLVVLIDEDTASASEILSSALHDNNRAVLIGTDTYGKGLVQKIFPLPNKTGMNLTIAKYLTPKGRDINQIGIEPDYKVSIAHNDFVNNVDSQLDKAKNYLEKEIKK